MKPLFIALALSGLYQTNWGRALVRETGPNAADITYPGGALGCTVSGPTLDCTWQELNGLSGRARFTRTARGFAGTWGSGSSASDGGAWSFEHVDARELKAPERFSGRYGSTWGDASVAQVEHAVTIDYGRGTMVCTASGASLDCDWREGGGLGRAVLRKQRDGRLEGTWGSGSSATDGGPWVFTRRD